MIISHKLSVQAATALLASFVLLLSFASVAQAIPRISVAPGLNGPVNAISEPDSNGTRYLGGAFTAFDAWGTGGGALVGASSGDVNTSFPKVNGGIFATVSDGSGGFYIGGDFDCIGPDIGGGCNGADDVVRNSAAHINADGSVDSSWNPNLNNAVRAIGVLGSTVYLGGNFTTAGGTTRNYAAAVDTAGALTSWNPDLNSGGRSTVNAIGVSGSTVYLGGYFTTAGGTARNSAAAVDTAGTLTSWNPDLNSVYGRSTVNAIGVSGSTVYLGGDFTTVRGTSRNNAAAVATDGTLTSWNPALNGPVSAIGVSGSTVYLGGQFTTVGGTARNYAAAVDTAGTLTSWNPDLNSGGRSTVSAIAVSGSNVYLGGSLTTVGGTTRNYAAAVDTAGTLTSWNPDMNGDVYAIAVSGSNVYLGGGFTTVGGTSRNNAAAVGTDGTLSSWNPDMNGGVYAIGVSGSNVYLGGWFTTVGGTSRRYAAAVATDGTLTSWNPNLDGGVRAIAVLGSNVYLGGWFSTVGGTSRNNAAAVATDGTLTSWNPNLNGGVTALAVLGSNVYLGGWFTTVGGIIRNLAAAVGTDGTLSTSWNPSLNGGVNAIAVSGSNVYLGGQFSTVGGTSRRYAAAVRTDGILTDWDPNLNNEVFAMTVSGSTVYLGGYLTTVGGTARNRAAAVGTNGILTDWNPNLNIGVRAMTVSGSTVYLGGAFTTVGGTTRNYAAAVSTDGVLLGGWLGTPLPPPVLFNLSVTKSGLGSGTITSSPAGIDCGADCSETVVDGTSVTLTATPTSGSSFSGWNGSGCSGTSTCIVTMSEARAITAEFAVVFDLTLSKSGTGAGTITSSPAGIDCGADCSETLVDGSSVTLTATPAAGSSFTGWTGAGCSGTLTCTVTMSEARSVTAQFTADLLLSVTKSGSGAGTVTSSPAGINCGATCSTTVASGTSVTLTATPATGSSFAGWNGSGCSGTSTCTVTMSEARSVTAQFTADLLLSVTKSGSGAGTVTSLPAGINCGSDCSETLEDGTSVTLTATSATGSTFTGWSGAGCSGTSACTVVMSAARAVNAEFAVVPPPSPGGGSSDDAPTPPAGRIGVSINSGARYTNDPEVRVAIVWPFGERSVVVSNDGGFLLPGIFPVAPTIAWRLDSSGPERLPKTVYVRFGDSAQNFQDDIILDETAPTISVAKLLATVATSARVARRARAYTVKVKARDATSGVGKAQVASKKASPLPAQKYSTKLRVKAKSKPSWIRVQDKAGNWSRWKKLR